MQLQSKVLIDPSDFKKGLPKARLPELTDRGMILALKAHSLGTSKLTYEGTLKLKVTYTALILQLLNRYVEVKIVADYEQIWIGMLFGVTVRGIGCHNGIGTSIGCRVTGIQNEMIKVEVINEGGLQAWDRVMKKVHNILDKNP